MIDTKIPLYAIFVYIALLCGLFIIYKNAKNNKLSNEEIFILILYIFIGAIIGGKCYTYIIHHDLHKNLFDNVGLSSYGAVIGIFITIFIYIKIYKKNIKDLIYIILPSLPLMYAIAKIGCFFAGCCYGIEYDGIFNITYNYSIYAPANISVFPIQLLETILYIIIYIITTIIVKKGKHDYKNIGIITIIGATTKFLTDYLRTSSIGHIISLNQAVSLVFIIIGIIFIIINKKKD